MYVSLIVTFLLVLGITVFALQNDTIIAIKLFILDFVLVKSIDPEMSIAIISSGLGSFFSVSILFTFNILNNFDISSLIFANSFCNCNLSIFFSFNKQSN